MKVRVYGDVVTPERFWPVSKVDEPCWNAPLGVKLSNLGYEKELSSTESTRFINGTGHICLGDIADKFNK